MSRTGWPWSLIVMQDRDRISDRLRFDFQDGTRSVGGAGGGCVWMAEPAVGRSGHCRISGDH